MAGFFRRLRRQRDQESGGLSAPNRGARVRWTVLESVGSPAMGSIYIQILQQADIPVLTQQWGAGAGAMGGALTGVRLLVPEDRVDEAREVLGLGRVGSEDAYE